MDSLEASALKKSMEMEMEMSKCMKESEDEQTTRIIRERKKVDQFGFLPDDILLEILRRVPDVFLRYKAKYVSKRWFNIITKRILLDHVSYILQKMGTITTRLLDIREEKDGLQVKEQGLDIPHEGKINSWCNEVLLISGFGSYRKDPLYVYNLITKKGSYLPKCNVSSCGYNSGMTLSYDESKGIYKAAHLKKGLDQTFECHIVTITSEAFSKFKKIQVPYKKKCSVWSAAVSVRSRYLNWRIYYSSDLVSVDMVKEEISIISLPGSHDHVGEEYVCSLFAMGGFLALCDGVSQDKVEIWVLKDFHREITWEKLHSITDSNGYFNRYSRYIICHIVKGMVNKRYIILKTNYGMHSYDLKSGVMKKLDIHILCDECWVVNSLAPSFI